MLTRDETDEIGSLSRFRLPGDRRAETAERRSLRRDLATATAEGHFLLHFQPRLALRDGKPMGGEALLRWPHRKRGLVSPAAFLPLAEETGHILEIGAWVLRQACRAAVAWPSHAVLAVNIAARQLPAGVLAGQVADALAESGLPPEQLVLELHETVLLDITIETMLTLSAIRDLGVGLALDDFASMVGSLTSLKRLPLTAVNLDRTLVRSLPESAEDSEMVRAITDVAHALGLLVVAEGIETEGQRGNLVEAGCDEGQGSLFSHALPASAMAEMLASV